jgi:hypothetical protein
VLRRGNPKPRIDRADRALFAAPARILPTALRVGFQNSAAATFLAFYAARSYSLVSPPRTGWRLIRALERSAAW